MSLGVIVQDDVLVAPLAYRAGALALGYSDWPIGSDVFRSLASVGIMDKFAAWIGAQGLDRPTLTFFRRSKKDQPEPNYVHHDSMMGDWTAILYLNPEPHPGDGTIFWEHVSGAREGDFDTEKDRFFERFRVKAQFNRAVIFPSKWFHSRALFENYGTGDDARLIQVAFGKVA